MKIQPVNTIKGEIEIPGDKSISHRSAIFAAMAEGESCITNYSTSVDCASTLNCLRALGVKIESKGMIVKITGVGKKGFNTPEIPLDCGNSGTTMRLLAGVLAGQGFDSVLIGDESLKKRPMGRIIKPLELMGAAIKSKDGTAPLKIRGKNPLTQITYQLPIASAQLKSAIILAGLNAKGKTIAENPLTETAVSVSRDHTELMLKYLGVDLTEEFVEVEGKFKQRIVVDGESSLTAADIEIPGDISATSFFLVAASCLKDSRLTIRNVGLNPTRAAIIDVLKKLGARIEISNQRESGGELVGDIAAFGIDEFSKQESRNKIDGEIIANIIDEIPVLAVLGTQMPGGLEIRDASELRVKESDRIDTVVKNLKRMGADVDEFADGFFVRESELKGAQIDSFGDHRIAMAFAIAGLIAEGETEIIDSDCAGVSFPNFFEVLKSAAE